MVRESFDSSEGLFMAQIITVKNVELVHVFTVELMCLMKSTQENEVSSLWSRTKVNATRASFFVVLS